MRLLDHYDRKYASQEVPPQRVPIVAKPTDRFQMLVKIASQNAHGRYLEIGAGSGATLLTLEPYYDELVGTELSAVRARDMQRLLAGTPKIKIISNNVETDAFDYPGEYFDTIALSAVIEHLLDPITAIAKFRRLLRPGGRLILDTPNIAKWTRRVKLLFGYFPATASLDEGLLAYDRQTPTDLHDEGHFHYFTFRSLRRICLERAGFKKVEELGYGRTALSRYWPALFSEVFLVATR